MLSAYVLCHPVVLLRGWLKLCGELLRTCHLPPCQAKTVPRRIPWPIDPLLQMMPPPRPRARIEAPEKGVGWATDRPGSGGTARRTSGFGRGGRTARHQQPKHRGRPAYERARKRRLGAGWVGASGSADPRGDPRAATRIRSVAGTVAWQLVLGSPCCGPRDLLGRTIILAVYPDSQRVLLPISLGINEVEWRSTTPGEAMAHASAVSACPACTPVWLARPAWQHALSSRD